MNKSKGFSLVELLVVVAIIGVLASVGAIGYDQYVESSKKKVLLQNFDTVAKAINFERVVIGNGLTSALKEFDGDGNMIKRESDGTPSTTTNASEQTIINENTSCHNFIHSVKEHFKEFKNPWQPSWVSITVDDKRTWEHRKGQIHIFCWNSSIDVNNTYGVGSGCPASKAKITLKAYTVNKGRWSVNPPDNQYRNRKDFGQFHSSVADAKAFCGWDDTSATTHDIYGDWAETGVEVNADAGGTCGSSKGTPICD